MLFLCNGRFTFANSMESVSSNIYILDILRIKVGLNLLFGKGDKTNVLEINRGAFVV